MNAKTLRLSLSSSSLEKPYESLNPEEVMGVGLTIQTPLRMDLDNPFDLRCPGII
jgi:hypothetical protein